MKAGKPDYVSIIINHLRIVNSMVLWSKHFFFSKSPKKSWSASWNARRRIAENIMTLSAFPCNHCPFSDWYLLVGRWMKTIIFLLIINHATVYFKNKLWWYWTYWRHQMQPRLVNISILVKNFSHTLLK